jgi:hypothetical protein
MVAISHYVELEYSERMPSGFASVASHALLGSQSIQTLSIFKRIILMDIW